MRPGLLFICGSLNQTTMPHRIAGELAEFLTAFLRLFTQMGWPVRSVKPACWIFPFWAGGTLQPPAATGRLSVCRLILAGGAAIMTRVATCTDLLVQKNIRGRKLILVQEGITEPDGLAHRLVRSLGLPRWIANTAATGLSNAYDVFCVASEGYRDFFAGRGVKREKMAVTGIPNFDNFISHPGCNFPLKNYVLVATSSCS